MYVVVLQKCILFPGLSTVVNRMAGGKYDAIDPDDANMSESKHIMHCLETLFKEKRQQPTPASCTTMEKYR